MRVRRWWGTGAVVAAGVCGALVAQGVTGGFAGDGGDGRPGPVRDEVRSAALKVSADGGSATLGRRDTETFSMLGVTWQDHLAAMSGTVEVRTRAVGSGAWSDWLTLDSDNGPEGNGPEENGPEENGTAARGGTEPAWVGPSDGVEVRVNGKPTTRLPQGLRLDMIGSAGGSGSGDDLEPAAFVAEGSADPTASESATSPGSTSPEATDGTTAEPSATESAIAEPSASESAAEPPSAPESPSESATPSESASGSASASPSASAPPSTVPQPTIMPRSAWGADESLSPEAPAYLPGGKIKAAVVHHTAQSNAYTCAEAPSVINAIYTYDVTALGWKDLGYNFVVDKCGTVYEGRKGGVGLPVVGAHAYGFNSQTTGIAVLGTYTDSAPPPAAMTSVARVAAWKLGQYGVDPDARLRRRTEGDDPRPEVVREGLPQRGLDAELVLQCAAHGQDRGGGHVRASHRHHRRHRVRQVGLSTAPFPSPCDARGRVRYLVRPSLFA
ncbi:N-acetylmuramoyl-L-alanine amidase OS=Streptomyces aurantiogriseus OX=66870 GN=GCM10010251_52870 PE=3 SV=1 [Streptomyces aurantiogriseus]